MDTVPRWIYLLAAGIFGGVGVWALSVENWGGVAASLILTPACLFRFITGRTTR